MNLLTDKWISVVRADGNKDIIAPYEITSFFENNPVQSFDSPRMDFKGALAQFLIGLLQTALPALTDEEWDAWYAKPPSVEALKELFSPLEIAFNFNQNGPRFMQDFDLDKGEKKPISALLIEQPGEQTLELNTDHFIKRNSINKLCYSCAAMALFTLQINAPGGGAGHRTSVRGGGPLTTLVISDNEYHKTLWDFIWLNIIPAIDLRQYLDKESIKITELKYIFPWLSPTRTSEKISHATLPEHGHPFQAYWSMPRRIRLDVENTVQGACDICAENNKELIQYYITKNYGINYTGTWRHPLSPYRFNKDNLAIPLHPQQDGIGYKYWQALVLENPAFPVIKFNQRNANLSADKSIKIWAFGYDMDNMKARCWYESIMPFYVIRQEVWKNLSNTVSQFIDIARQAQKYLYLSLKETNAPMKTAELNFWHETEGCFYIEILHPVIDKFNENNEPELDELKLGWLSNLKKKSLEIFDRYVTFESVQLPDIHKIIRERKKLLNRLNGPKIRKMFGLSSKGDKT